MSTCSFIPSAQTFWIWLQAGVQLSPKRRMSGQSVAYELGGSRKGTSEYIMGWGEVGDGVLQYPSPHLP